VNGTNLVNGSIKNGPTISGATTASLTIKNVQTNNSGNYTVIVTNIDVIAGPITATSSNAFLTVVSSPMITVQPTNQTIAVGSNATFTVTAIGTVPLHYQWWDGTNKLVNGTVKNGPTISGTTTTNLTIKNAQTTNSGNYTVVVTNLAGSVTSSNAVLTVASSPVIIMQPTPTNQATAVGSKATFAVAAIGIAPLRYQWQINGTNLVDGTNLVNGDITSGSTTTNLTISNAQTNNSGAYTVVITNIAGSVTSSNALLTVIVPSPSFGNIQAESGVSGSFILSGAGGASNGTYYVLISTNLLLPLTNWTSIATNQFDSEGDFIFTNTAQTNVPQLFYLLQLP
jgi:hypothetical protein